MNWNNIFLWLSGFYFYAFFSNPHLLVSITRKNFASYKFKNQKLVWQRHAKPKPLPNFLLIIAALREGYLILLRFHWIEKILRRRPSVYHKIYESIVRKRFYNQVPYLIAGDHFSSFYPRNLGFFYSKALNPITILDTRDYQNRLVTYLNSLSFCLDFYEKIDLTTTIIPFYGRFFCRTNVYSKPADTLTSILLGLDYLIHPSHYYFEIKLNQDLEKISMHDFGTNEVFRVLEGYHNYSHLSQLYRHQTKASILAKELLTKFKPNLKQKVFRHLNFFDPEQKLIHEKHSLSGIRDGLFRKSSFYENVTAWKTIQMALKLKIILKKDLKDWQKPEKLKAIILKSFYKNNIIYNQKKEYDEIAKNLSADFLVAFSVGFLNPKNKKEFKILENQIQAFIKYGLMTDLGPMYSKENPENLAPIVWLFARDYMGKTVWSHWSVEMANLMISMYEVSKKEFYLIWAKKITCNLKKKILKYKGYPELYDIEGNMYKTPVYVSMLDTGWIVNFQYLQKRVERVKA